MATFSIANAVLLNGLILSILLLQMQLITIVDAKNEKEKVTKTKAPKVPQTKSPTLKPTATPTATPTSTPTGSPTDSPSIKPSSIPRKPVNIICLDSTDFNFGSYIYNGNPIQKSCAWITSQDEHTFIRQTKHCNKVINGYLVQDLCPIACNRCDAPSMIPTSFPSFIPTIEASFMPSKIPSSNPTMLASSNPSISPTFTPSISKSSVPSSQPSSLPSISPTTNPSLNPSMLPSKSFSQNPSITPSITPTRLESMTPSTFPTVVPSKNPSIHPTTQSSDNPSNYPSYNPSKNPSNSPSKKPSNTPSNIPSNIPTDKPSIIPSINPSTKPSNYPSTRPSNSPSKSPSDVPSNSPSSIPSTIHSSTPSLLPSAEASQYPSHEPSSKHSQSPTYTPSSIPSHAPSQSPSIKVELGHAQTGLITENGELKLWGSNLEGQIGPSLGDFVLKPTKVADNITQVAFGTTHTCAIVETGLKLKCWGDNRYGQLGNDSTINSAFPITVLLGTNIDVRQVELGNFHSCVVLENNELKCWGYNRYGQVGDGTTLDRTVPRTINLGVGVKEVSLGDIHTCALLVNQKIKCWGSNLGGQLGDGSTVSSSIPKEIVVGNEAGVRQIALGGYHTCVVLSNKELKCWGFNQQGQIGTNSTEERYLFPTKITMYDGANEIGVMEVSLGGYHTCAILVTGDLICWGDNSEGQLGVNSTINSFTPKKVSVNSRTSVKQVSLGKQHSCAVLRNGELKCWGSNWSGQIGDRTIINRLTPKLLQLFDDDDDQNDDDDGPPRQNLIDPLMESASTKLNTPSVSLLILTSCLVRYFVNL